MAWLCNKYPEGSPKQAEVRWVQRGLSKHTWFQQRTGKGRSPQAMVSWITGPTIGYVYSYIYIAMFTVNHLYIAGNPNAAKKRFVRFFNEQR